MNQVRGLNDFQIPQVFLNQDIDQSHLNIVTNRREQARHQIRNEEVKTFLNRKRKLPQFYIYLQKMIIDPNEYYLNELKEIYYHEANDFLKLEYQAEMRRVIIEQRDLDSYVIIGLIEILKIEQAAQEKFKDKENFFFSLFDTFQDGKQLNSYIAYMNLIYQMIVWDENLISSLGHQQDVFQKLLVPFINYNQLEVYELAIICERIFRDDWFTYNLKNKDKFILSLFKTASMGQECEENAEAICRLTSLLKQLPQQNRILLLSELKDLIPIQLNNLTLNNYIPAIVQKALIYWAINAGQSEQLQYLKYFIQFLEKMPLKEGLDFFERFWLSIYDQGPKIKQITRNLFKLKRFWYLIEQIFSTIIQKFPFFEIHLLIGQYYITLQQRAYFRDWYRYLFLQVNKIITEFYILFRNY